MSLYLKYRPAKVEELDLKRVREALGKIVESGNLAHAYLFDGPRGSGKTSSARILAKVANCMENDGAGEPCLKCEACKSLSEGSAVDLIEIDAASNRGIDDIRELKQKIKLSPSRLRKKVYIIDEVHMLTTEAFNALLKTLEEPPEHALFVLCTTESHKIPETIISRCTRIQFSKANQDEMKRSLKRVIKGEKVKVDEEAVELLAKEVDGSFRDGVKILDQLLEEGKKISRAMVEEVLYGASGQSPMKFVESMIMRDAMGSLSVLKELADAGVDMKYLLKFSMEVLRDSMLSRYGITENKSEIRVGNEGVELIKKMDETINTLSDSSLPVLMVEMLVLEWCRDEDVGVDGSSGEKDVPEKSTKNSAKQSKPKTNGKGKKAQVVNGNLREKLIKEDKNGNTQNGHNSHLLDMPSDQLRTCWRKVMKNAMGNYSLEALLNTARLRGVESGELVVEVDYAFHKQQLETERFRKKIEELADLAFGKKVRLRFEVSKVKRSAPANLSDKEERDNISEIEDDDLASMAEDIFKN